MDTTIVNPVDSCSQAVTHTDPKVGVSLGFGSSLTMAVGDKLVGAGLVALSACIFVYYTLWVLVLVRI
jgi:hypothetical protein